MYTRCMDKFHHTVESNLPHHPSDFFGSPWKTEREKTLHKFDDHQVPSVLGDMHVPIIY